MNRKISVGMAVSIVILAMTVTFSITMLVTMRLFDSTVSSVKEKESMYNKIAEVDRYVRSNDYYQIDETTLYDRLTAGYLLGTGDKYARYYTASAYTDLMNAQNGTLLGIGVELAVDQSGYAKVTKVYDESPAKEAGITVGCYITAVDGTDVKSLSGVDAIQTRLRGESGTSVNVTWLDSEATEHTVDLTHSGYSTTTVDFQMLQGNVGYIKIRQFDYLMTEGEDGKMVANEDTMREITCYAEPKVLEAQSGERFQFFRHGYFVADSKLYSEDNPVFNEIIGLKSSWKK